LSGVSTILMRGVWGVMCYRQAENVVAKTVAGEVLLVPVHVNTQNVFTLNREAYQIWQWLDEPCSVDALAARLASRYGVSTDTAQRDVRSFLDEMLNWGLVREA
jgi:hypothetical protein